MVRIGSSNNSSRNRNGLAGSLLTALNGKRPIFAVLTIVALLFVAASEILKLDRITNTTPNVISSTESPMVGSTAGIKEVSDKLTNDLLSWLKSNGSFIDERVSIRHVDPTDPTSIRGIFADHGSFEKGETLFTIPNILIYNGKPRKVKKNDGKIWRDGHADCGTTYEIHDAMLTGSTPYGRYLAHQPKRYVPGYWSSAGRKLLGVMLGDDLSQTYRMAVTDRVLDDWLNFCKGATMDELEVHASQLVQARADGSLMIPIYDMINHRNGHWYNTEHSHIGKSFALVTNQKVRQGEQFYMSYNTCTICGSRTHSWGTLEMFMDYGFVEPFPHRYVFSSVRLKFGVDEKKGGGPKYLKSKSNADGGSNDGLVVKWYVPPSQKGLDFLKTELDRLQRVQPKKDELHNNFFEGKEKILESEWNASWMLHEAMLVAFQTALDQAPAVSNEVWNMGDDWWKDLSGAVAPNRFY